MPMSLSLRAFLGEIIDFAGMFPPAEMPLNFALKEHAKHRKRAHGWLMGRFLCRTTVLEEVAKFPELLEIEPAITFSAIGAAASTAGAFGCGLFHEYTRIDRFRSRHGERVHVHGFEAVLPIVVDLPVATVPVEELEDITPRRIAENLSEAVSMILFTQDPYLFTPYFELPAVPNWRSTYAEVIEVLSRIKNCQPGFKLRCGGQVASAIPPVDKVAFIIAVCRDAKMPLKFTAGLHQPFRHDSSELKAKMHGFVNVFAAGVFAHALGLSEAQIRPILEEEDATKLVFTDEGMRWHDYFATTAQITSARTKGVISFGSCSFEEPIEGLQELGWL